MVLVALPTERASVKLGLSVPRKFGTAATRNKFKRRLREVFRRADISLPGGGANVCVLSRPEGARAEFLAIRDEFLSLWEKARLSIVAHARPERSPRS